MCQAAAALLGGGRLCSPLAVGQVGCARRPWQQSFPLGLVPSWLARLAAL